MPENERRQQLLNISENFESQITDLKVCSTESLRRMWASYFRRKFPDHLPGHLIIGLIAWRLQADRYGGLSKEEEKFLAKTRSRPIEAPVPRFGVQEGRHQAGTVFVREHAGVAHRVVRTADGYEWGGKNYRSLSAVASAITGTNWNGLRFFGISAPERSRRVSA